MYQPPFKYQDECNQNEFEWVHSFYSSELLNKNNISDDYTVMLIEGDEFKCVFNWAHFDEKLYKMLAPVMCQNAHYYFTNINEVQDYDILSRIYEKIIWSADLHPSWDKYQFIYLYPNEIANQQLKL